MLNVFVTDSNSRKALCVTRSLGAKKHNITVGSEYKVDLSKYSKFSNDKIKLPSLLKNESIYVNHLLKVTQNDCTDVLIPMEDETVRVLIQNKSTFNHVKTLLPNEEVFNLARDKGKTMKIAIENDISIPTTYFIEDLNQLIELKTTIKFPVLIKPRLSSGSRGITLVRNAEELDDKYSAIHNEYEYPIVQEFVEGDFAKIQVLIISDKSHNVKASCVYEGLREFPVEGGPVTLWKTIHYPSIETKTIEFMEKINWTGFAEVEYLVDKKTNQYYLMEINPRFSANIALAVNVGIDFPELYVKLAMDESIEFKSNDDYNKYCQWLIPGDIMNFIFNKNRFRQEVGYFFNKPKNLSYAILSKNDLKPALAEVLSLFTNVFANIKNLKAKLSVGNR